MTTLEFILSILLCIIIAILTIKVAKKYFTFCDMLQEDLKNGSQLISCILPTEDKSNKYVNIYITSDDEIKEGNWFINNDGLWQHNGKVKPNGNPKKVVASTDTSLNLPQPTKKWLDYYIEQYNKGNIITSGKVEMEDYLNWVKVSYSVAHRIKINPDNTINILIPKEEKMYSKEEVVSLIYKYSNYLLDITDPFLDCFEKNEKNFTEIWIEENLK